MNKRNQKLVLVVQCNNNIITIFRMNLNIFWSVLKGIPVSLATLRIDTPCLMCIAASWSSLPLQLALDVFLFQFLGIWNQLSKPFYIPYIPYVMKVNAGNESHMTLIPPKPFLFYNLNYYTKNIRKSN